MRSVTSVGSAASAVLALWLATAASAAAGEATSMIPAVERPTHDEVTRALEAVKADPNLAPERTITTLRWKEREQKTKSSGTPPWLAWIAGLFGWIARSARVLVWGAAFLLAAVLAAYLVRVVQRRDLPVREKEFAVPTHVRDLDIRPDTLPDDIGAAARILWERGERRAALALLYRGLLSRLAHDHRLPIRDSTTEGDCLALARTHLAAAGRDYVSRLVPVWQRAVYGREPVEASIFYGLCDDFAAAMRTGSRAGAAAAEGTV